mmetsp:Transcript_23824/g.66096  ORF Transcript_23824/g.66096 Transcript_23824/m.66096 type:complete len:750 (+) Transcript_23824:282-2531(+)|eukprot:CAMPEP_0117652166 /NCGR_PEP_ID=MMETSP0804-20121206/2482_1 /TAXON_ID=1074897 /ORGANISM="Tetraselmis astigmatica, Strain CCMP880" /LENGTH=749 /DNA_ID=CAMNT_0005458195 /DNA_START=271 /DNA_END=2520 /DNA_ORIENTATION=-
MARGSEMAVALRARGGRNMMLHTRGIATNDIKEASKQVVANLARFSTSTGKAEADGSGDHLVSAAHGHMSVNNGRHNAVYRLVNSVYVIGIAAPSTALFSLVRLVDSVTKQLVVACHGTDVTVDKVAKNYAAVYSGTSAALDTYGSSPAQAAVVSASMLTLMFPEEAKKDKKQKKKADQAADAVAASTKPRPSYGHRRSLIDGPKLGDATVDKQAGIPPSPARSFMCRTPKSSPKGSMISTPDHPGFGGAATAPSSSRPSHTGDGDWDAFTALQSEAMATDSLSLPQVLPTTQPAGASLELWMEPEVGSGFDTTLRNSSLVEGTEITMIPQDGSWIPGQDQDLYTSMDSEQIGFANFGSPAIAFAGREDVPPTPVFGGATDGQAPFEAQNIPALSRFPDDGPAFGLADFTSYTAIDPAALEQKAAPAATVTCFGVASDGALDEDFCPGPAESTNTAPFVPTTPPPVKTAVCSIPPTGQSFAHLQLLEVWEAEFHGNDLVSASIAGEVQLTAGTVTQNTPAFTIKSGVADGNPIHALLKTALLAADVKDGASCRDVNPGCYLADFDHGDELNESQALVRYQLPPSTVLPPMIMKVSVGTLVGAMPGGPELVSVQYAVSPMLRAPLQEVVVQVELSSGDWAPVKGDPQVEWCAAQRSLQWCLPSLNPAATGAVYAVVETGATQGGRHFGAASGLEGGSVSHACARFVHNSGSFSGTTCVLPDSNVATLDKQPTARAVGMVRARLAPQNSSI